MGCWSRGCSLGVSGVLIGINKLPSSDMGVLLSPLLRVPPKTIPPEGAHGFRGHLRRSGMRASEDCASTAPPCYAACNAPAERSDGALPTHSRPALGTHTVAAALKRASPCERLVSGSTSNEITSCLRTSRSEFSLDRLRKRDIVFGDALNECSFTEGNIRMKCKESAHTNANALSAIFGCRTRKHPVFGEART